MKIKRFISFYGGVIALSLALLLNSCQKEEVIRPMVGNAIYTINSAEQGNGKIVLGQKLNNPYTLSNIRKAMQMNGLKSSDVPVHKLYVRFLPETIEQLASLTADTSLYLSPIPFDYEVLVSGTYYQDTTIANQTFTWLYTVVEPEFTFGDISYEILDSLYFPEDESLEQTAMQLSGYLPENEITFKAGERPSGIVQVFDTEISDWLPVRRAKVQVIHFGRILSAETNDLGRFSISTRFYAGTQVNVLFYNARSTIRSLNTTSLGNILTIPATLMLPATHFDGWRSASNLDNMTIRFGANNPVRFWAHIHNAVQDFYDFATQAGISNPPSGLCIYAHWNDNNTRGAAPMFGHFNDPFSLRHETLAWLTKIKEILNTDILSAIGHRMPDVIIEYDSGIGIDSERMNHLAYHEIGHTSHYSRVGAPYWASVVSAEAANIIAGNNAPYGRRGDIMAPLIGLCEAWAETIADDFITKKYFWAVDINNLEFAYLEEDDFEDRWIPYGIFYDMTDGTSTDDRRGDDNTANPRRELALNDNVSGFTLSQINTTLNTTVVSPQTFNTQFQIRYSANNRNLDALFTAYGY